MATVNLGRIKPVFRGAYSGSTAYVVDDIVTHGNESFICIQAHGAGTQATTQGSYWTKLAAKGTDGTNGTDVGTVITTQGDILYRDGSGLQRLAKGTSGQALLMNSSANAPERGSAGGDNKPMFRAGISGTTIGSGSANTYYKMPLTSERFDVGGCYNATNSTVTLNGISTPSYSFAPNVAGKYMVGASYRLTGGSVDSTYMSIRINKNGNEEIYVGIDQDGGYYPGIQIHGLINMNGTSDYISANYSVRNNWYDLYDNTNTTYFYAFRLID